MENSGFSLTNGYQVDASQYEMPDFYEFYNDYGNAKNGGNWINLDSNSLLGRLNNFFFGDASSALSEYNRQKEVKDRQFQEAQAASARQFQEYMESTKYQRLSEDLRKSGLNPWLAVQNSLGSAPVGPTQVSNRSSGRNLVDPKDHGKEAVNGIIGLINTAVKIIGLIAAV